MNERQRILELVKKGILSTEEGLDLLESMAKAKDEAQIKQAADKVDSYHRDQATNLVDEWETGQDTEEAKGSEKQDLEDLEAYFDDLATEANQISARIDEINQKTGSKVHYAARKSGRKISEVEIDFIGDAS